MSILSLPKYLPAGSKPRPARIGARRDRRILNENCLNSQGPVQAAVLHLVQAETAWLQELRKHRCAAPAHHIQHRWFALRAVLFNCTDRLRHTLPIWCIVLAHNTGVACLFS